MNNFSKPTPRGVGDRSFTALRRRRRRGYLVFYGNRSIIMYDVRDVYDSCYGQIHRDNGDGRTSGGRR